jgi:hypothetical protein
MLEARQVPRNYKIFICHRYGDHQIYAALRHALDAAAHFSWTNLSIQPDRPLRLRTENGLKASLTHKVKNADIVLVLSHSAGPWIDHEIDTAVGFGIPIISVLDPKRLGQREQRIRTENIAAEALAEVRLDQPAQVVAAVRRYARAKGLPVAERRSISLLAKSDTELPITRPQHIAQRLGDQRDGSALLSRLGALLFWRGAAHQHRVR